MGSGSVAEESRRHPSLFSGQPTAPELMSKMHRFFFFLLTTEEETIKFSFHLVLHGPRKDSNFKLQGDNHSEHESLNPSLP